MIKLPLKILEQPDDATCGPTCLHALYQYYEDQISLEQVIQDIRPTAEEGTLGVILGTHALERGYHVRLYTYNLVVFDPTWFLPGNINLANKLKEQAKYKKNKKLQFACQSYLKFLELGGEILFQDLTSDLIKSFLKKDIPILTGLSATYLYQSPRELPNTDYDDVRGGPAGHFVVLSGIDEAQGSVHVADPWQPQVKGFEGEKYYWLSMERVISSILLGIVTYDANLLVITRK